MSSAPKLRKNALGALGRSRDKIELDDIRIMLIYEDCSNIH